MPKVRPRITPFLWFDGQAEEAAEYYVSVFGRGSRILSASPMSVTFELEGQRFIALNGGPMYKFTEAISLFVDCEDQREVDDYWHKLGDGGQPGQCGWLKDRWGLSWQVVPRALGECLGGADREGAQRAMAAMLKMSKLDVDALRAAYAGKPAPAARAAKGAARGAKARGATKAAKARGATQNDRPSARTHRGAAPRPKAPRPKATRRSPG